MLYDIAFIMPMPILSICIFIFFISPSIGCFIRSLLIRLLHWKIMQNYWPKMCLFAFFTTNSTIDTIEKCLQLFWFIEFLDLLSMEWKYWHKHVHFLDKFGMSRLFVTLGWNWWSSNKSKKCVFALSKIWYN